ncbi:MAG: serine dehydratase subunit alpha family protein [Lachnospiraceae bacterium]|nr:serine dehydratase subunit alpha family protein [Lachnospiraceae bacterium]
MKDRERIFKAYETILNEELVPAMGCTEPIALAYCAAKARSVLGKRPERVLAQVSGNIIKNVKSVIVPNTNGAKGIEAAVAIGIVAGREDRLLEVLSEISDAQKEEFREYLRSTPIQVSQQKDGALLDMSVSVWSGSSCASVRIAGEHTNIVRITKDDEILLERVLESGMDTEREERYGLLNVEDIYCFATEAELSQVEGVLKRQIEYNRAAAEEGLRGDYGANIGSVLLMSGEENVRIRAKAMAAAGSDARMNGSELPVVINSGSGNQGLTVSLPVMEYAKELGAGEEKLYRALALSNLIAIHLKRGIGPLSAYCGAVSAGVAAGAGIAYLKEGDYDTIAHTVVNGLAIASGMICDGAKASCAAKIAVAVEAGLLGYDMYRNGQQFYGGDGVVAKGVENTIRNISWIGSRGMKETDQEILNIMTC